MDINNLLLLKLEKLSSLKIEDSKREKTIQQLTEIVNFVEILNELDVSKSEITFTTIQGGTPFRNDEYSLNTEVVNTIFKYAPKSQNNFFIVPKIIE